MENLISGLLGAFLVFGVVVLNPLTITQKTIDTGTELCHNNGGVKEYTIGGGVKAYCNDGARYVMGKNQ